MGRLERRQRAEAETRFRLRAANGRAVFEAGAGRGRRGRTRRLSCPKVSKKPAKLRAFWTAKALAESGYVPLWVVRCRETRIETSEENHAKRCGVRGRHIHAVASKAREGRQ